MGSPSKRSSGLRRTSWEAGELPPELEAARSGAVLVGAGGAGNGDDAGPAMHWWWGFDPVCEPSAYSKAMSMRNIPSGGDGGAATRGSSRRIDLHVNAGTDMAELKVERELYLSMIRAEYWSLLRK